MSGASILGMQRAYKSNIDQIKKSSPLKTRKKYLGYKHINKLETKNFSEEEMVHFKLQLKKQKQHDRIISITVTILMLMILLVIVMVISGKF